MKIKNPVSLKWIYNTGMLTLRKTPGASSTKHSETIINVRNYTCAFLPWKGSVAVVLFSPVAAVPFAHLTRELTSLFLYLKMLSCARLNSPLKVAQNDSLACVTAEVNCFHRGGTQKKVVA